jgi:hypothetical protein
MRTSHTVLIPLATALLALPSLAAPGAHARSPIRKPGRFGLGLGLTTLSTGVSAKYVVDRVGALQFGLGSLGCCGARHRWGDWGGVGFGVDYLFEMPTIAVAGRAFELAWNFGPGLGFGFDSRDHDRYYGDDNLALAASFVLGLEFDFIPIPLDVVLEWRPNFLFVPAVDVDPLDFTAHVRGYF